MPSKVENVIAFIVVDEMGEEEILGRDIAGAFQPFLITDHSLIKTMYPYALTIAQGEQKQLKIIQFSHRDDITEQFLADHQFNNHHVK